MKLRASMPTRVAKGSESSVIASHEEERHARDVEGEARARDLELSKRRDDER
jgi:hypothetical protein